MKSNKILVILSVLVVLSLVAGLIVGVVLRDPEQGDGESSAGMIAIFVCLWTAITARRRKSTAQHDEENEA